jgi:hypothetical protein
MKEIMKAINEATKEVAATKEQANTKAVKKTDKKPETKKASKISETDVKVMINKLPDTVTPKQLCELFKFDDGGKTIRRHLRKQFAEKSGHEHKADWKWAKNDPVLKEIVTYFAERYDVQEPEAKAK